MRASLSLGLGLLALAGCQATSAPSSPDDYSAEESILSLEVGSCLNDIDQPIAQEMTDVPTVPCDDPHQSEVYAEILVDEASFPGIDAVVEFAAEKCTQAFESFIGLPYIDSELSFHFYYPTANSWAVGDRSVFCVAYDPEGATAGSLEEALR
jgi:hypothetical protein